MAADGAPPPRVLGQKQEVVDYATVPSSEQDSEASARMTKGGTCSCGAAFSRESNYCAGCGERSEAAATFKGFGESRGTCWPIRLLLAAGALPRMGWAIINEALVSLFEEMRSPCPWTVPLVFVGCQAAFVHFLGDTLFGTLTHGAAESLLLPTRREMWWHMVGGSALWLIGAFQVLGKPLRHGRLAMVHRVLGRLFLLLFVTVLGPSAVYLSLMVSTGPGWWRHAAMTAFSVVSIDTAMYAYYFFWRGFCIARRRANGAASLALHGKVMSAGILCTATILFQRPLQLVVVLMRLALLALVTLLSDARRLPLETTITTILDHHVVLSVTTVVFGVFLVLLVDGPRSALIAHAFGIGAPDEAEELFGSKQPSFREKLFWRLRVPMCLLLRGLVTSGWTDQLTTLPAYLTPLAMLNSDLPAYNQTRL